MKCGSNIDVYYFGYLLNKATSKKKNIILSGEILIIKKFKGSFKKAFIKGGKAYI